MQTADLLHSITACWPKLAIPCGQWLSQRLHLAEEVMIEGRRLQILEQVCVTSAVADVSGLWGFRACDSTMPESVLDFDCPKGCRLR